MAGFIRRYTTFPDIGQITQIEGVVIVDLPPPGTITGVGVGTTAVVGEFADCTYACSVDINGIVTPNNQPIEIFSAQDLIDKVGGFDPTLGDFGGADGNGFFAIKSKRFSRLVGVPLNLASTKGVRSWRQLATNKTATDPTPIISTLGATVAAGTTFNLGAVKVNLAQKVNFANDPPYLTGTDGATPVATGVTGIFASAGSDFVAAGVMAGDALVLGVIGATGALGSNAKTYRVQGTTGVTGLIIENLDGTALSWATGATQPFRLHPAETIDTGGNNIFGVAQGCTVLARPLTDNTGLVASDGTISAGSLLRPVVLPPDGTATTWDPLSGLSMAIGPSGLFFNHAVHPANIANGVGPTGSQPSIPSLYQDAINSLLIDQSPSRDVNILTTARTSRTIVKAVRAHVDYASSIGVGRIAPVSPGVGNGTLTGTQSLTVAAGSGTDGTAGSANFGVGSVDAAGRDERIMYSWPGVQFLVQEAVGIPIKTAIGTKTTDGMLDCRGDMWLASVMSVLAPERNPGQSGSPVSDILSAISGFQRGAPALGMNEYILMKQNGICGLRNDRTSGFIFQSGITTSLVSGQKNINRRRMADYIQDSIAAATVDLVKQPLTKALKTSIVSEIDAFLGGLLSPENPAAQRIDSYIIDQVSGNTQATAAASIFVVIYKVRTTPTANEIVFQSEIGEGVITTTAA